MLRSDGLSRIVGVFIGRPVPPQRLRLGDLVRGISLVRPSGSQTPVRSRAQNFQINAARKVCAVKPTSYQSLGERL
jgi:hypothetical protein